MMKPPTTNASEKPIYVSSALNTKLLLATATSNSTTPKIPNDKFETCETKTQNAINSDKQTKSQISSLESTYGKTEENAMSSQTKTNSFGNGNKNYRKELPMCQDFQNISTGETEFHDFLQPSSRNVFRNSPNIYYDSEGKMNGEKNSLFNTRSILADSQRMNLKICERIPYNLKKSNSINNVNLVTNMASSRRKQDIPQKRVRFLVDENNYSERVHKMRLHSNFQKDELAKLQNRKLMKMSHFPYVHVLSNSKPQCSPNYVQSRGVDLRDITNLQKTRHPYTAKAKETSNLSQRVPLFYHVFNPNRNAVLGKYRFQRPLVYRQSGTATRGSEFIRERCQLIAPKQMIVQPGKTAIRGGIHIGHAVRSTMPVNDPRLFRNSLKVNFASIRTSQPQNYPIQPSTARFDDDTQKYKNSFDFSNFGLVRSSQQLKHQVPHNIASIGKNTDTTKPFVLKIQGNGEKQIATRHCTSDAEGTMQLSSSFQNVPHNKLDTFRQSTSEAADMINFQEVYNPDIIQNAINNPNISDQHFSERMGTVQTKKLYSSLQNVLVNNKPSVPYKAGGTVKEQNISVDPENMKDTNNKSSTSSQHTLASREKIKKQSLYLNPQNSHSKLQEQEENTNSYRTEKAKEAFAEISELLCNISDMLSKEFECPVALEISLPIWKAELEVCRLSAEKIKTALSEREKEKK